MNSFFRLLTGISILSQPSAIMLLFSLENNLFFLSRKKSTWYNVKTLRDEHP